MAGARRGGKKSTKGGKTRSTKPVPVSTAAADAAQPPREDLVPGYVQPVTELIRGRRKTRSDEAPRARRSNHKIRSNWFRSRAAFPVREAPVAALIEERGRVAKSLPVVASGAQWELAGPTNIGGRITSLVCHPAAPERIWAGAAGGGVWFSPDEGQSWTPQWHNEDVLNVGSLAIDPLSPEILYCGTGEANLSADSYAGVGIYRTLDAGASWHLFASRETTGIPARIGVIAIDPHDRTHIRIGGVGYGEVSGPLRDVGGMYVSRDAGVTWRRETFISTHNYWCHSIVFDPVTQGTIYATFTQQGMRSGIYRSRDDGRTWEQLTRGLPLAASFGRTTLAIAPSQPGTLYAIAADQVSRHADALLGVFRSRDGGENWTSIAGDTFAAERQLNYGSTIAVHPQDPDHVLCGGVDLHLTTDGGRTWEQVTKWDADRGEANYAHADHHCLLMPAARPGRIYDANDGGMDVSTDGGRSWINRSSGLAVTMFYDADISQSDSRLYGGGAQDNGTVVTNEGNPARFMEVLGGDGGWIVWDPNEAGHFYASAQFFFIVRFRNGRADLVTPPEASKTEREQVWMCYIALDPNDSEVVFTGTHRVWRTLDDAQNWLPVSDPLDDSPITAIEIADADSRRIYAGTENGGIFRSEDGGDNWTPNIAGSELPGYEITRLATSPRDAKVLYATVANFPSSHVFRSRDGGDTWEDIDNGQLPRVPHHVVVVVPRNGREELYVGNDAGVFSSPDDGHTWINVTRNLPNVMVVDLVHHLAEDTLIAATYGRSLWRLKL
jgi:photosystem II stability/assembly factor-like uncharacterized protein